MRIEKRQDGQYGFPAGSGCAVLIGDGLTAKVTPRVRAEKWAGSRWGSCWLDLAARDVEPDVAAEKRKKVKGKDALEIECVRTKKDGKKSGEVHRILSGSTEWDVEWQTLADVPADGLAEFDVSQPAGLEWHYQGELEPWERGEPFNADRPENVIGSYALYWKTAGRILDTSGREIVNYDNGKFAHLYRPVCIAADGSRAWAAQVYDGGILRIALPMDWLRDLGNKQWPVTLDPYFGYETVGGTGVDLGANYIIAYGPYTAPATGTITAAGVYGYCTSGTQNITTGVYDTGSTVSLLADSAGSTWSNVAAQWWDQALDSGVACTLGGTFLCADNHATANGRYYYDAAKSAGIRYKASAYSHGALPSTYPSGSTPQNWNVTSRLTYTETGNPWYYYAQQGAAQ